MIKLLRVIRMRTWNNKMNSRKQLVTEGFSFPMVFICTAKREIQNR